MPMSIKKYNGSYEGEIGGLTFRESGLHPSSRVTKLGIHCPSDLRLQYRRYHCSIVWLRQDWIATVCAWSPAILTHVYVRQKICIAHRRYHRSYSPGPEHL
ncbi:hypothetical protein K439DRAFT_1641837 [Ramaria rubella]|nr:hypothetical protein K439DRAFT_1641837 [Ramaria rubella]